MIEKRPAVCMGRREDGTPYHYYSVDLYESEEEAKKDLGNIVVCMSRHSDFVPVPVAIKPVGPMPKVRVANDKKKWSVK